MQPNPPPNWPAPPAARQPSKPRSNSGAVVGTAIGVFLLAGIAYWVIFGIWGTGMLNSLSWLALTGLPMPIIHLATIPLFLVIGAVAAAAITKSRPGLATLTAVVLGLVLTMWMTIVRYSSSVARDGIVNGGYYLHLGGLTGPIHLLTGWMYLLLGFLASGAISGLLLAAAPRR